MVIAEAVMVERWVTACGGGGRSYNEGGGRGRMVATRSDAGDDDSKW